jgi:hypothetical protein
MIEKIIWEIGSYLYFIEIFKVQNAILFSAGILKIKINFLDSFKYLNLFLDSQNSQTNKMITFPRRYDIDKAKK